MSVTPKHLRRNLRAFLWHAAFLALAASFMDVGTIIPSMLIKAGGTSVHLGLLTAIMMGGASLSQLAFSGFLHGRARKKRYLLWGIHLRVASLLLLALLFFRSGGMTGGTIITLVFVLMSAFAFGGSFANVSYVDILGKSVLADSRKRFFSIKQVINSVGILTSALIARDLLTRFDYPVNYGALFLIAGFLLWIASGGFWRIREVESPAAPWVGVGRFIARIPAELRRNRNLLLYLLVINTLGLGVGLLPFAILLAKHEFGLGYALIGNFLLLRTIGMLATGLILFRIAHRVRYRHLLTFSLVVGSLVPVLCLLLRGDPGLYQLIFVLAGTFVAAYQTAIGGVLLEISSNENRAVYAGIAGAGNILTTLFPLLAGWLIPWLGFPVVFVVVMVLMVASYAFVRKLRCGPDLQLSRNPS